MTPDTANAGKVPAERPGRERSTTEAKDYASAIDAELSMLLPALQGAQSGRVIALTQFRRLRFIRLIPFHLHLRWPDAVWWLPLNATIAVIPFNAADLAAASLPVYRVSDAREARRAARQSRLSESRNCRDDFVHPDWEVGASRLRTQLNDVMLPPRSFVCIERVRFNGGTIRLSRPTLGRHAARDAPRPTVRVAGAHQLSAEAITELASADLMVVDLQRLRGKHSLQAVRAVLAARPMARPTLIVASSPSDLFAAELHDPPAPDRIVPVGPVTTLESAKVIVVGRDRLVADERFFTALRDLAGQSPGANHLVTLAENAWWAVRQAVDSDSSSREVQRFKQAHEILAREDPFTAELFTSCMNLLQMAESDVEVRDERRRATMEVVLNADASGPILILARRWKDVSTLREAIAAALDLKAQDLQELGVYGQTYWAIPPHIPLGRTVLVGYAGMATIDAALASGSRHIWAIVDPVEARTAWYHARHMADYLLKAGALQPAESLRRLAQALAPHVVGFSPTREMALEDAFVAIRAGQAVRFPPRPLPDEAIVCLTDGLELTVPLGALFEVLGRNGLGSRVVTVTALEPGDQVILLDEDARTLFSERRIAALDAGVLRHQREARSAWLAVVRAVAKARGLTVTKIANQMRARGYGMTEAAIGRWLSERPDNAHVPMKLDYFFALADVLGVELPRATLHQYFQDIHRWRVGHRRAGHEVARAIRLAYTGRLGPATLARIERDWGVGVRDLIDAAQIGIVDEVIVPEEVSDVRKGSSLHGS